MLTAAVPQHAVWHEGGPVGCCGCQDSLPSPQPGSAAWPVVGDLLQYEFDQYNDEYDDTYDSHSVGAADSESAEDLFTVKR